MVCTHLDPTAHRHCAPSWRHHHFVWEQVHVVHYQKQCAPLLRVYVRGMGCMSHSNRRTTYTVSPFPHSWSTRLGCNPLLESPNPKQQLELEPRAWTSSPWSTTTASLPALPNTDAQCTAWRNSAASKLNIGHCERSMASLHGAESVVSLRG